jgi:hypothetical protein
MNLQKIKDKIEAYPKNYQVEIGKLLLEHKINLNENQNGMFVNLSQLPEDILDKIVAFMNYADAQEMTLNTVEHTKDGLKDIYFNNYND